jgi:HTH-type transcriptional regulator / antitoxin HipB
MCGILNMTACFSATEFGAALRAERVALGRTLQWVADRVGCRRQTIADLEAGKNVGVYIAFAALAALDKGLSIVDSRMELDRLKDLLDED